MCKTNCHLKKFDEITYLKCNPDVFEAVNNKFFRSGLEHYIYFGYYENRMGVSSEFNNFIKKIMDENTIQKFPPEHLRKRVHGSETLASFKGVGQLVSLSLHSAIQPMIQSNASTYRFLDFGCGCGRIFRYLHKLLDKGDFYGTDIDQEPISWCQDNFSQIATFIKNDINPPLPFNNTVFDFVYSVSVFTHLPEEMQFEWLEELKRVTKIGGYLLLTTHGEDLLKNISEEDHKLFLEKGFYYRINTETEGLPDFYQTSYHTDEYIYKYWGKFFLIEAIIPKAIDNYQNLIVCKRT